ncbi:hypothetical protein [Holospora undulata]|uniref:Uncharacterized protein n=1 Tax=Holospora undulata HU1 TaxID=1321371 RepID=A0A061JIN1_9PROT|nr:hypothetical protein [Holospora undulata]ETZ05552.1 hypothetical protein K737_300005 [Holospora undulata HU1]
MSKKIYVLQILMTSFLTHAHISEKTLENNIERLEKINNYSAVSYEKKEELLQLFFVGFEFFLKGMLSKKINIKKKTRNSKTEENKIHEIECYKKELLAKYFIDTLFYEALKMLSIKKEEKFFSKFSKLFFQQNKQETEQCNQILKTIENELKEEKLLIEKSKMLQYLVTYFESFFSRYLDVFKNTLSLKITSNSQPSKKVSLFLQFSQKRLDLINAIKEEIQQYESEYLRNQRTNKNEKYKSVLKVINEVNNDDELQN